MAEGGTASIGTLELQVQSDASKAAGGLTRLANSLGRIKELVEGGMQLGEFGNQLGMFTQQIARIGSQENVASIHKLSEAINELANSAKSLSGTGSALKTVERIAGKVGEGLSGGGKGAKGGGAVADVAGAVPQIEAIPDALGAAKQAAEQVAEGVAKTSENAQTAQQSVMGLVSSLQNGQSEVTELTHLANNMKEVMANGATFKFTGSLEDGMKQLNEARAKGQFTQETFMALMVVLHNAKDDADALARSLRSAGDALKPISDGTSAKATEALPDSFATAKQEAEKVTENVAETNEKAKEAQQSINGMANAMREASGIEITTTPRPETHARSPEEIDSMRRDLMNRVEPLDSGRLGAYETLKNAGDKAAMAAEKAAPKFEAGTRASEAYAESLSHVERAARPASAALETTGEDASAAGRAYMMANGKLGMLMMKAEGLYEKLGKGILSGEMSSLEMAKTGLAASSTGDEIAKLDKKMAEMSVPKEMSKGIADTFVTANEKIGLLSMKLEALKEKLGSGIKAGTLDTKGMAELGMQIMNITAKIEKLKTEAAAAAKNTADITKAATMTKSEAADLARKFIDGKMNSAAMKEEISQMETRAAELRHQLASGLRSGGLGASDAAKLGAEIAKLEGDIRSARSSMSLFSKATEVVKVTLKSLKDTLFSARGGMLGFLSSMMRVAKYRLFRSLIRSITEGFTTGLKNLREYSKAVDNLYNRDMTGLENATFKMKNSLGAALGSALQSLIPILQQLSQWVINVANAFNQFFALIGGRTSWTRAVDAVAADFEKTKKEASGAAKEAKNLLASWDELNIIQSKSGGNGSGNGNDIAGDYADLFEEVDEFDSGIESLAEWFKKIKDDAWAIAAAFAAWKIGVNLIPNLATISPAIAALTGIALGSIVGVATVYIDWKYMTKYLEDGEPTDFVAANAASALGAALAGMLVGKGFNSTAAGLATSGAILSITGLVDMTLALNDVDAKGINQRNIETMASGAIKSALGLSLFMTSLINAFRAHQGHSPLIGRQVGGIAVMAGAITGMVAVDLMLTKGALKEDDEHSIEKIIGSLGVDAAGAALAALGGWMYGGKDMAVAAAGGAITVTALTNLTLGIGSVINDGVTFSNIATMIKGALGLGAGAAMLSGTGFMKNIMHSLGFKTGLQLGTIAFGVAASVSLSASINTDALEKGSKAEAVVGAVTDALTSTTLGVIATKMTGSARTGALATGIDLTIKGVTNFLGTLQHIDAEPLDDATKVSLIKSMMESALGTGLLAGAATGHVAVGIIAGVLALTVEGIALYLKMKAADAEIEPVEEGTILLTQAEIDAAIGTYFPAKATITLEAIKFAIADEKKARDAMMEKVIELAGLNKIWLKTGVQNLTDEEYQSLVGDVNDIVTEAQKMVDSQAKVLKLAIGLFDEDDANTDILSELYEGVQTRDSIIKKIGKQIGDILAQGTAEGYSEVIPQLVDILTTAAGIQERSEIAAKYDVTMARGRRDFVSGYITAESLKQYEQTHTSAVKEIETEIADSLEKEVAIARANVEQYEEYLANPDKYAKQGISIPDAEEKLKRARETLQYYQEHMEEILAGRIAMVLKDDSEAFANDVREAVYQKALATGSYDPEGLGFTKDEWEYLKSKYDIDEWLVQYAANMGRGGKDDKISSAYTGDDTKSYFNLDQEERALYDVMMALGFNDLYGAKVIPKEGYGEVPSIEIQMNGKTFELQMQEEKMRELGITYEDLYNLANGVERGAITPYELEAVLAGIAGFVDKETTPKGKMDEDIDQLAAYYALFGDAKYAEDIKKAKERLGAYSGEAFTFDEDSSPSKEYLAMFEVARLFGLKGHLQTAGSFLDESNGYVWFDQDKMHELGYTFDDLIHLAETGSFDAFADAVQQIIWSEHEIDFTRNASMESPGAGGPGSYEIIAEDSQVSVPADAVYVTPAHDLTPISPPGAPTNEEPGGEDDKGASKENQEQILNRMRDILTALDQIYRKEFNAVLVPSVGTGQVVSESLAMYDQTYGT